MEYPEITLLTEAQQWLKDGEHVFLVTVIKTWGASPRPVGSLMAISNKGHFSGSVSGGCIEEDLIEKFQSHTEPNFTPKIIRYGGTQEQQTRFQLPCGGTVELLIEYLPDDSTIHIILDAITTGDCIDRVVNIATGEISLQKTQAINALSFDGKSLRRTYGPLWKLLIIGAGELSRYVAEMAMPLGYQVTVCDPRQDYARNWNLSGTSFDQRMPDDVVDEMGHNSRLAVLTLSHDPKLDDLALIKALPSNAFYVGALGSKATNEARRERLKFLNISDTHVGRLKGPVGLPIGARTPAEIAISILADMTLTQTASGAFNDSQANNLQPL